MKCAVDPVAKGKYDTNHKQAEIWHGPLYHPNTPSVLTVFQRQSMGFL